MKIKSYAKINLALDVIGKAGKYHEIRTVFQQIGLHDEMTFKKISAGSETGRQKITILCDHKNVPRGQKNTVYKAARLLQKYAAARESLQKNICGVEITVKKNIPVAAGLGGGSSNGAAALVALNKLWHLKIPKKEVRALAARVGMDAPFFIRGGTALGTHFGEKIVPLPACKLPPLLIAVSGQKTSTANVYRLLNLKKTAKKTELTTTLLRAIESHKSLKGGKHCHIHNLFHNDFETLLGHKIMAGSRKNLNYCWTRERKLSDFASAHAVYALYKNAKTRDAARTRLMQELKGRIAFIWRG